MPQKMQEFAMAVVRLPLGDTARNRNCRAADLIGEAVNFLPGKVAGCLVDFRHQVHGLLPNHKIFEMLRHIVSQLGTGTECWVLLSRVSYMHYIAVLHDVVFAFQSQRAFGAGVGFGASF